MKRLICLLAPLLLLGCDADDDGARDDSGTADTDAAADTALADTLADVIDTHDDTAPADTTVEVSPDTVADTAVDTTPPDPPQITLTVNAIPASMNGSEGYTDKQGNVKSFSLRVNREYFTLDVIPHRSSGPVDWAALDVNCTAGDEPLTLGAFEVGMVGGQEIRRHPFDAANAPPDGVRVSCDSSVDGPGGSTSSAVAFDAATLPPSLDPFAEVDEWLVVLSRDIFDLQVTQLPDGTYHLRSNYMAGGNGVPDFDEPFYLLGLFSDTNSTARGAVKEHLLRIIRREANRIYGLDEQGVPTADGVRLRLWFEGDSGAPTPADFAGGGLSLMALGGDGEIPDQDGGTFGRAWIDWNNQDVEDDTIFGLGVFPTAVVRAAVSLPLGVYLLGGLMPTEGGLAIGDHPGDVAFIGKDGVPGDIEDQVTQQRAELYDLGMRFGGLALASILTHEIGHSLGLVPFGAPPEGLFAGIDGPVFRQSFAPDAHINTAGLNVMQTGGSVNWLQAISAVPEFNPLNWAYLRRQLVVGSLPTR